MTEIEIEYCVPCGFRNRALDLQQAVLTSLEGELDAVRLVMGDHGVFQVRVDGDVIYDKEENGLDIDEIVREIRDHG